jgi:hypothetical protein
MSIFINSKEDSYYEFLYNENDQLTTVNSYVPTVEDKFKLSSYRNLFYNTEGKLDKSQHIPFIGFSLTFDEKKFINDDNGNIITSTLQRCEDDCQNGGGSIQTYNYSYDTNPKITNDMILNYSLFHETVFGIEFVISNNNIVSLPYGNNVYDVFYEYQAESKMPTKFGINEGFEFNMTYY